MPSTTEERDLELDAHLEQINARLPGANPEAAFTLGMLTTVFLETRKPIPAVILDAALEMRTIEEACNLVRHARDYASLEPGRPRPSKRKRG